MTKLNWEKTTQHSSDPGRVVEVSDYTKPSRWVPPHEQAKRDAERRKQERDRKDRIFLLQEYDRLKVYIRPIKEKKNKGVKLNLLENASLNRWYEIKKILKV